MKKIITFFVVCLFLAGCKSKKTVVSSGEFDKNLKAKDIIEKHKESFPDFKTLSGNVLASYDDGSGKQSLSLSFRMEKDKAIWLSAPLGIAKAFITPERASYYNRLDNTHFDGDFSYISKLLGFEVDFHILQNLLLGQSVFPLTKEARLLQSDGQYYVLEAERKSTLDLIYGVNLGNYRLGFFDIRELESAMQGKAEFSYQEVEGMLVPDLIKITTQQGDQTMRIELDFSAMKRNENVNFPFKIPSGTKEIK